MARGYDFGRNLEHNLERKVVCYFVVAVAVVGAHMYVCLFCVDIAFAYP